jgi:hypothetical protein
VLGDRKCERFVGRPMTAHSDLVNDSFSQPSQDGDRASLPFVAAAQENRAPTPNPVFTFRALRRTPHRRQHVRRQRVALTTCRHDDEVPESDPPRRGRGRAKDEAAPLEQERSFVYAGSCEEKSPVAFHLLSAGGVDWRYRNQPRTWNLETEAFGGDAALSSERRLRRYEVVLMHPHGIYRRGRRRITADRGGTL